MRRGREFMCAYNLLQIVFTFKSVEKQDKGNSRTVSLVCRILMSTKLSQIFLQHILMVWLARNALAITLPFYVYSEDPSNFHGVSAAYICFRESWLSVLGPQCLHDCLYPCDWTRSADIALSWFLMVSLLTHTISSNLISKGKRN